MDYVYLSATQIGMFLRCARQWAYRYVERLIVPPSGAMKQSGVFHSTAERNYLQKIDSHRDLPLDELSDFFGDTFEKEFLREEIKLDEGQTKGGLKDQGVDIVRTYHAGIAPQVQPVEVERRFELNIGRDQEQFRLVGVIDVVDEAGRVRDNKAMAPNRVPNAFELARDIQLSTYSLARRMTTKQVEPELRIDAVIKYAHPMARSLPTQRSREGLRMHLNTIGNISKAIRADAFPRNPTGWWCSERFCGYWSRCIGKGMITLDMGEHLEQQLQESISDHTHRDEPNVTPRIPALQVGSQPNPNITDPTGEQCEETQSNQETREEGRDQAAQSVEEATGQEKPRHGDERDDA